MDDQFDVSLEDTELLEEIGLTCALIAAAGESETPLRADEIDQILEVGAYDGTPEPPLADPSHATSSSRSPGAP